MSTALSALAALPWRTAFTAAYLLAGIALCAAALFGSGELAATFSG
jgi:hypothetical protein